MRTITRRTTTLLAISAAALSGALGLASSASAQSGFVSIKPKVAPRFDVAQGAQFPLAARDSSAISFAETWRLVPASDGHVLILNRLFKNGATELAMDIEDTTTDTTPPDPGSGQPVGTSPRDGSFSQQWKVVPVPGTGTSQLINRQSKLKLAYKGTGFIPAYVQSSTGLTEFTITPLP